MKDFKFYIIYHEADHGVNNTIYHAGFEVFTAVIMKNAVFCDVAPCRSCVNQRFGGTYRLNLQGRKIRERGNSVSRWLQTEQSRTIALWNCFHLHVLCKPQDISVRIVEILI
jgi:hypothetical protein